MRPSRRLLVIASVIAVLSVGVIAVPAVPPAAIPIAWGLLALGMLVDAALTPAARRFALEPAGRREVFAGEETALRLRLVSLRPGGAPSLEVLARVAWPEGLAGPPEFALEADGNGVCARPTLRAVRRGVWPIGEVSVLRRGRLGLLDRVSTYACDAEIAVVPNIRSITSGEIDLQIASETFGSKSSSLRGEGSEFHQLRDFVAGMDARTIDYKRSARHGALVARQMQAERNHNILLALDTGHLMREEIEGLPKLDHMIKAALALSWAGIQGGDLVGLYSFDARPHLFVPPGGGRRSFAQLRSHTAALAYRSVETNHTLAISHLHQRLGRRSLVVIFSDFVDTTTAELLVENAAVLIRHHVVVFVTLRDPLLQRYANRSAEGLAGVAEAVSVDELLRERRLVLERLARLGTFVIEAEPGAVTARLVSTYLMIKSRELI